VSAVISIAAIVLMVLLTAVFAIIAMNASCFVSIYRLKTGKAIASGFDLFIQMQLRSIEMMLLLVLMWIVGFALVSLVFGIILFIGIWFAHFIVSPDALAAFLKFSLTSSGLLISILLGILFVTNAVLTAFGDTAWALFFLDHVSSLQLPKKKVLYGSLQSSLPEAETA
jgi:hypothetical protein